MTPESEAKRLGLDYIGFTEVTDYTRYGAKDRLYQFNDPKCNNTTIAVWDVPDIENKMNQSRKTFKGE